MARGIVRGVLSLARRMVRVEARSSVTVRRASVTGRSLTNFTLSVLVLPDNGVRLHGVRVVYSPLSVTTADGHDHSPTIPNLPELGDEVLILTSWRGTPYCLGVILG